MGGCVDREDQNLKGHFLIHLLDYINTDVRHMDQWRSIVPQALTDAGHEVNMMYGVDPSRVRSDHNLLGEIYYKSTQFNELYNDMVSGRISQGDILIFADAWNPMAMAVKYISLVSGINVTMIGCWRDGIYDMNSKIRTGLLRKPKRWAKSFERGLFDAYDFNCFISDIQLERFMRRYGLQDRESVRVTGLPFGLLPSVRERYTRVEKKDIIVLPHDAADPDQREIFLALQRHMTDITFIDCHDLNMTSDEYYSVLNRAKAVIAINLSESDPTNMYEGMLFGCVPIVPDKLIYSEIFPRKYWYPTHYTQPPFMNFVRGREFMHERIRNVFDNYDRLAPSRDEICQIGELYFKNDGMINLIQEVKDDNVTKSRRRRAKPQRKFSRSGNDRV